MDYRYVGRHIEYLDDGRAIAPEEVVSFTHSQISGRTAQLKEEGLLVALPKPPKPVKAETAKKPNTKSVTKSSTETSKESE